MADTEVVDINMTSSGETTSSLLKKLEAAFVELEAHKVVSSSDVQWNDVEEHLNHLESMVREKLEELEAKQKVFTEKESHNLKFIAEREAAVALKEQDMLDMVQELKDAAVASIAEARAKYMPESVELASGNQVNSSIENENAPLDGQDGKSPSHEGENAEVLALEVNSRAELTQFCEQMDSKGLLNFLTENLKNLSVMENLKKLSDVCKEQLSVVLGSATEPARLVLEALEGFFPPKETTQDQEGEDKDAATSGMLQSCIILMEALSTFLTKAESGADNYLYPEIKQNALAIANEWKPKLFGENIDAANVNSLEAEGFLQLLATFRIVSDTEFDQEQLCQYILAVSQHRQAIELCHSFGLAQKIPDLVETLISSGRQIDAVHFIHAFQLTEAFPTVPILRAFLKELRRNSQGNGIVSVQNNCNARELEALRGVIKCIQQYDLEAEYPLEPLLKRLGQLERSVKGDRDRKRTGDTIVRKPEQKKPEYKKPRFSGEFRGSRARGSGDRRRHGPPHSTKRPTGLQEMYPSSVSGPYSYPVSSSSPYSASPSPYAANPSPYAAAQATIQSYGQESRPQAPYSATAPSYTAYMQPSRYPYM